MVDIWALNLQEGGREDDPLGRGHRSGTSTQGPSPNAADGKLLASVLHLFPSDPRSSFVIWKSGYTFSLQVGTIKFLASLVHHSMSAPDLHSSLSSYQPPQTRAVHGSACQHSVMKEVLLRELLLSKDLSLGCPLRSPLRIKERWSTAQT